MPFTGVPNLSPVHLSSCIFTIVNYLFCSRNAESENCSNRETATVLVGFSVQVLLGCDGQEVRLDDLSVPTGLKLYDSMDSTTLQEKSASRRTRVN